VDWQLVLSATSIVLNFCFLVILTLAAALAKSYLVRFEEHKTEDERTKDRLLNLELQVAGKHVTRDELNVFVEKLTNLIKENAKTIDENAKNMWNKLDTLEKVMYVSKAAERRITGA
jgi:transcription termination factor NusB